VTTVKSIEHWVDKDEQDKVTAGMSVGITVADEFFNQRGEFISHLEDQPLVTDTFKVNLFWLGKKELVKHKEYILKLATQEVSCEIVDITQVIDATTLDSVEQAKQVKLNDVAEVIIKTKQKICLDAFKNNQHTGRFVIVDGFDVCGGGIVSGLAEKVTSKSTLSDQEKHIEISCFDEFYYVLAENTVKKISGKLRAFKAGDVLPVTGQTYEYPADFSIVDLQHKRIAQVRNAKLRSIVDLAAYRYLGETLVETGGAGIKVESEKEFQNFMQAVDSLTTDAGNAKFSNQWFRFGQFKTVRYLEKLTSENLEYHI
jgi:bifunctional enzyme CysN/CysC/sulfate adenylyltransferase subunit 1